MYVDYSYRVFFQGFVARSLYYNSAKVCLPKIGPYFKSIIIMKGSLVRQLLGSLALIH